MAVTTSFDLVTLKSDFRTNTFTLGPQLAPDVLGLSNGGFVTAYNNTSITSGLILLDFYDAEFQSIGAVSIPFEDSATTDAAGEPSVTQLANGNVLVVWDEQNDTNSEAGIKGALYTETGTLIAADVHLDSGGTAFKDLDVTALSNGNFAVSFAFGSFEMFQLYTPAGAKIGGAHIMNTVTAGTQRDAQIAALDGGGLVAAWTDDNTNRLKVRVFEDDGSARTAELGLLPAGTTKVALAGLPDGGWAAAYRDTSLAEPGTNEAGISLLISNGDGSETTTVVVSEASVFAGADPDVTVLANGFILVTWSTFVGASQSVVSGRVFDPSGETVDVDDNGGAFGLSDQITANTLSSVSLIQDGRFVTSWQDSASDGSSGQISSEIDEVVRISTGDAARDLIVGDALRDRIDGGKGADTINGAGGADSILGGDGADELRGGDGDDTLDGGARGDSISGEGGDDLIIGGPAILGSSDVEGILGGEGNDTVIGGQARDSIGGDEGNDSIDGGAGEDFIRGGKGADTINGGGDNDTIFCGPASGGFQEGVDSNQVDGGDGNDTIEGEAGADTLLGGLGDDRIEGRGGADRIDGGDGVDELTFAFEAAGVTIDLATGHGLRGFAAGDIYLAIENVTGTSSFDEFLGSAANNRLDGAGGDDSIDGGDGRDVIIGGLGFGDDTLAGGKDADRLTGGFDSDFFIYRSVRDSSVAKPDLITDFSHAEFDRISLRAIDAREGGKDNAFVLVGAFSGAKGELVVQQTGAGKFLVQGDVDGDGVADFAIEVVSSTALVADDFAL